MKASDANSPLDEVRGKLAEARLQVLKLEEEIARLERRGQLELPAAPAASRPPQSPAEKVALFLDLFGTRRSVFPKRWENAKTGKSGYAPACDNEWRPGVCSKPQSNAPNARIRNSRDWANMRSRHTSAGFTPSASTPLQMTTRAGSWPQTLMVTAGKRTSLRIAKRGRRRV